MRIHRTAKERQRIVVLTLAPGASIARVARENWVNANQFSNSAMSDAGGWAGPVARISNPVSQRGAFHLDVLAGKYLRLAIQGKPSASFESTTCASRFGPGIPRSIGRDGTGA